MKSDFDSFHGNILKSIELAGLALTETAYAPNLSLPTHSHQSAYFCYVLEGGFTEVYKKHSRLCEKSILIYHPAWEAHADTFHSETRCFNLKINNQWTERLEELKAKLSEPVDFRNGILPQLAARLYKEFCQQDISSSLIIEGLALEILGETTRQYAKPLHNPPLWLVEARELLHDQFHENLSLSEIARLIGVHETHLAREFRRFYHLTVGEYVRHLRIKYACRQLSASDVSLAEIAHAAGFFDQSHFGRTFKQFIGMTPAQYRKIFRSR
jgi:AraC family transcriptional regulator